ncbi:MAG: alpha/beta fold hydrolase [Candidatus Binatia bacterium]
MADASGDPGGTPVLLVHGGGQTRHAWGGTARALAALGWYAVALDLRGHGESGWAPDGDYSLDAFARDIVQVAQAFDRPPTLVGASLGGLAGLIAQGESAGDLVSAMVLVDVTPRLDPQGTRNVVEFMRAHLDDGFASLEEAADTIAAYIPHRIRPRNLSGLSKNLRRHPDGRYRWHWDPAFVSGRKISLHDNQERLFRCCRALRLPTLLVRGGRSDLVTIQAAQEFQQLVPHAQLADVAGAGHMVAGDRNDAFTRAILGFLAPMHGRRITGVRG